MHARKWLPALLAVACLTGCGGKTNDSSQPATTTTITNSPGDSIVTKLSDVADDIGDAGKRCINGYRRRCRGCQR